MIQLKIPFSEKDRAKEAARESGTPIRWDPDKKLWYYPGDTLPKNLEEFLPEGTIPQIHNPSSKPKLETKTPKKTKGPKVLQIDYTYLPFAKAAGAKWNPNLKVCTFEGETLPIELTGFEPLPYSWEAWAQEELTGERLHLPQKGKLTPRKDQETAIKEILNANKKGAPGFLLADDVGLGKEQSIHSPVLTPLGWKKMGELQIGDQILGGSSGHIQTITGVFPQGKKLLYRITFNDKTSTLCGAEHLWNVRDDNDYRRNKPWRTLSTKTLLEKPLFIRKKNPLARWEIPLCPLLEFHEKKLPIHPYLLGTLLRNGSFLNQPTLSTKHPEQLEKIKNLLPKGVTSKGPFPSHPNKYNLKNKKGEKNPLTESLRSLKIWGKTDQKKFIPQEYLFSSSTNRILLLQGLLDTDSTTKKTRTRFSSSSLQLANDILFLVRSLGGWASLHTTPARLPRNPLPNHIVVIQLPKIKTFKQSKPKKRPKKTIISITAEKEDEAICITTNDPQRLYLTDDLIVTHNTISVWESILRIDPQKEKKILILCPLGVIAAWRSTIEKMGDGNNRILLLNYDKLKKIYELAEGVKTKSLKGVARRGKPLEFDIIVFDESHKLKNQSARTKLATGLYKSSKFLIWMSATAGQNILELAYLAPLLASRTGEKVTSISKDFESWCQSQNLGLQRGQYGKWIQDKNDTNANKKIHELLFSRKNQTLGALRRVPQDLKRWPEIQRIGTPIELSPQQKSLYQMAWEEFLEAIQSGKAQLKPGQNPVSSPQGLAGLTRLRQKASLLKVEETLELTKDLLDNNRQVAISLQYLDPLEKILEGLAKAKIPATRFTGLENASQKEANRISYQKGENKVILFTVEEGISLHQGEFNNVARAQINHDPRWSAISANQIDGRSHRNGMFAPVYWLYLKDTIEEKIIERLLEKMNSMGEIHGDETESLEILKNALLK